MNDVRGSRKWTCGECGDSFESSGYFAGGEGDRWSREHKEKHRVDKLSDVERAAYYERRAQAALKSIAYRSEVAEAAKAKS